ncbi:type II restriction endonuclease [uncultured Polaribacter sp.]|uniref:type II restriction endonuclease n=1 Tax=uncultured Polaribacter sp. TaxID=174711 RepID=UPI0026263D68|nr:type II restriction endonuclease [uncultured Polaribacter sp.]
MKRLTNLLNFNSDDDLFDYLISTLKVKGITQWDYYVKWDKVHNNIKPYEVELNILNVLIGKQNIKEELTNLILQYPKVVNVIPLLLAIRFKNKKEQKINIVSNIKTFEYDHFDLSIKVPNKFEAENIASFFMGCGLGDLVKDKKVKNLVDYATGVEVGLDSNGRKNRGGHQMENAVEFYINQVCEELNLTYLKEGTAKTIKEKWGIQIAVDKSSRRIDYVINNNGKLYFFEVNFYNGGGSKLKSTATEYVNMNQYWNNQNIEFIWITDGAGWINTQKPLREYFDKAEYLLNLEMLKNGILKKII